MSARIVFAILDFWRRSTYKSITIAARKLYQKEHSISRQKIRAKKFSQ